MAPSASLFRTRARVLGAGLLLSLLAACQDATLTTDAPGSAQARKPREPSAGSANPLAGASFYVDPYSNARRQADLWRATRPADADQMEKIAARPQADWFGEWSGDVRAAVDARVTAAAAAGTLAVLVAYNVPQRDCGGLSGGGGATADAYRAWITAFADGIGGRRAVVVLEPDALAMLDCLSAADQQTRVDLLRHAVSVLRSRSRATVYLDAGHPRWHSAAVMADRLKRADVANAAGFSLNVSNFVGTQENAAYAEELSKLLGGKHAVIDTSRNGQGPTADNQWCNPSGRGLGATPTAATGHAAVDAYLWIKRPGESDGACNGGPAAGAWWPEYALELARAAVL